MHMIIKRLIKWLVRAISVFLPEAKAHELQRWRRGKEEFWKYNNCEYIFASYGKSGRTWVRVMISRYYQLVYKLPDNILMGFDNFTRLNKDVPKIFFTHDNYLRGYTGNVGSKKDFYNKNTVLLVRNPIDVAVRAMIYDAARGKVVLFGGTAFRDIWEWDGANGTWTEVTPAGITPGDWTS